jgi:quercetin dioxygenase-like cupin family protein
MENLIDIYALQKDEGQAIWFLDTLTLVKATGEKTGGTFGLIEQILPAGSGSPYHMHHNEDEIFYIIQGEVAFISGDRVFKAAAGSFVFLPRNIAHGFRTDTPTRLLLQTIPAGFEQFVIEMSEPAKELALPPAGPPDMEKLMKLAAKYNLDILGPLPEM